MPDMNLRAIPVMRQALEAIQREHEVDFSWQSLTGQDLCVKCPEEDGWPCVTRKLADEALDRMSRANQGGA